MLSFGAVDNRKYFFMAAFVRYGGEGAEDKSAKISKLKNKTSFPIIKKLSFQ